MTVHELTYIEEFSAFQRLRGSARRERGMRHPAMKTRTRFPGKLDRTIDVLITCRTFHIAR